jgi:hypothetical protein
MPPSLEELVGTLAARIFRFGGKGAALATSYRETHESDGAQHSAAPRRGVIARQHAAMFLW